jgi:hypothetical protein
MTRFKVTAQFWVKLKAIHEATCAGQSMRHRVTDLKPIAWARRTIGRRRAYAPLVKFATIHRNQHRALPNEDAFLIST